VTDAIGGRAYYKGRLELEFPTSSGLKSVGLRPSAFIDIGSLWGITKPQLTDIVSICSPNATAPTGSTQFFSPTTDCSVDYQGNPMTSANFTASPGFKEFFLGNSPRPR